MLRRFIAAFSLLGVLATAFVVAPAPTGQASSHREAPLIANDPLADNTDLYAFRNPDRPDTITIVANYIPLEEPNGGPNFVSFGDDVLYEIHIDNNGDARPEFTYQFDFNTVNSNPDSFLYAGPQVKSPTDPNFFRQQSYKLTKVTRENRRGRGYHTETYDHSSWSYARGRSEVLGTGVVPPNDVGPRTTPNYDEIAKQAIGKFGELKVFAGPRDDAFFVDLGSIFDLGGLRPFNELHLLPLAKADGIDGVNGYNTHSIIMQIPISELTSDKQNAEATKQPVLGIYASASRQRLRVLNSDGSIRNSGRWIQVSRLGNPLINEVIIPSGQKDLWNAQPPFRDEQFEKYYLKPELAGIVNLLYGSALQPVDTENRTDLSLILLQGVPGFNRAVENPVKADLLRLNVAIAPTAPVGQGNPLTIITTGNAAPDLAGFPNGRRLEDDVTDIELKAVAQGYGVFLNNAFGLPNKSPNNLVGDGVDVNDKPFLTSMPYMAAPHTGYDSTLHVRAAMAMVR
jgi:hypothetical protein